MTDAYIDIHGPVAFRAFQNLCDHHGIMFATVEILPHQDGVTGIGLVRRIRFDTEADLFAARLIL
ncbi:hypothetical protein N6H05_19415 [Sphingobium sp. WTD-1]|uniref:hypothetical protein n=1 Tax=Sphingobium sp. WTD-1 TaxID=2979467 RepID=UPI0024DED634|nr:hypothetical protein [Sphingobium sp. WTD-1]WIA55179.1 hypothetical protein N6H05_19415 [Sphingobium sp. WTD-1]